MQILSDFERAAWKRGTAEKHPPRRALLAAADQIDEGLEVKHAIVVLVVKAENGGDRIEILQAGDLSELAVEGALHRVITIQASGEYE